MTEHHSFERRSIELDVVDVSVRYQSLKVDGSILNWPLTWMRLTIGLAGRQSIGAAESDNGGYRP